MISVAILGVVDVLAFFKSMIGAFLRACKKGLKNFLPPLVTLYFRECPLPPLVTLYFRECPSHPPVRAEAWFSTRGQLIKILFPALVRVPRTKSR